MNQGEETVRCESQKESVGQKLIEIGRVAGWTREEGESVSAWFTAAVNS